MLHIAIMRGEATVIESVLSHRASLNTQTSHGDTPLMLLVHRFNNPVDYHLTVPGDINSRMCRPILDPKFGELATLIDEMIAGTSLEMINAQSVQGHTVLHLAVMPAEAAAGALYPNR